MKPGFVRIIAGEWGGRRLKVPAEKGLRPTPDSVRETLFNWLAPYIQGSTCLDLFAGSGALGFEALSRGAARVVMVDESRKVVEALREAAEIFKTDRANIYCARTPKHLPVFSAQFNIVFLDPPYQSDLLGVCCDYLEAKQLLAPVAYIYLEAKQEITDNDLPAYWRIIKSKHAGQVFYHLACRELTHEH